MWLVFAIFAVFVTLVPLVFLEDRLDGKLKMSAYYSLGLALVLMAGLREIGFDPDSEVYEGYFLGTEDSRLLDAVEISYIWLCDVFGSFTSDVHWLFLFYAFFGVGIKLLAFRKFSDSILLLLLVYVSYFFELHETCQIRTGILSAIMLYIVYYIAQSRRLLAFGLILLGSLFHMSGLALLPLLFLNNKPLGKFWTILLAVIIPVSYAMPSIMDFIFSVAENIPYIGYKLAHYNAIEETGIAQVSSVNIFSPFHLFTILVYYYIFFFRNAISQEDPYFPLLMKIFGIGMFFYSAFSFLPVLGERLNMLYKISIIILFADIQYTIKPRWGGVLAVIFVSFVYLNFILRSMYEVTIFLPKTP